MPAYARSGKIICFFQPAQKFGARYATLGFNDPANLDDGTMWPTVYAVTDLTDADARRIEDLIKTYGQLTPDGSSGPPSSRSGA